MPPCRYSPVFLWLSFRGNIVIFKGRICIPRNDLVSLFRFFLLCYWCTFCAFASKGTINNNIRNDRVVLVGKHHILDYEIRLWQWHSTVLNILFYGRLYFFKFRSNFLSCSKKKFSTSYSKSFAYGLAKCIASERVDITHNITNTSSPAFESREEYLSFLAMILKPFYWVTTIQIIVLHTRNEFFLGTFDSWSAGIATNGDELVTFTNAFAIISLCGGTAAPVTGIIVDALKIRYGKVYSSKSVIELKALAIASALVSTLSVLLCALLCIPGISIQYFSLVLYVFFRTSIYSNTSVSIATYYPEQVFGTLFGLTLCIAGVISLVRYPLLSLALRTFGGSFTEVKHKREVIQLVKGSTISRLKSAQLLILRHSGFACHHKDVCCHRSAAGCTNLLITVQNSVHISALLFLFAFLLSDFKQYSIHDSTQCTFFANNLTQCFSNVFVPSPIFVLDLSLSPPKPYKANTSQYF